MWIYYLLKIVSSVVSFLPYSLVVLSGKVVGRIYHVVAKKQRLRAERTISECLGYDDVQAEVTIKRLFINLGITFMEILYMPALNKDNIRGLVSFDNEDILWETLNEGKGVILLACHMDNWEWLGAALALNGFPVSAVEKPQPNRVYSDFMNELRRGVGQEIFSRGTNEILGCARAMKKGRMLGLIADQDGGYGGIFAPFLGKMASTPVGPAYFSGKFGAPIIPIFIVRKDGGYGHRIIVREPIRYEATGDKKADDYKVTLQMNREIEKIIEEYPDNWIWFQHRWNTPYEASEEVV
ncbi:MAG: lysophospholipid acyltransferase family protein [Acidaminococcaceae bacterium]|nr:lysophospholipid acyltransferase family protein [Acidaminococcaceae bacterium]